MTFEEYLKALDTNLSEVKIMILKTLWDAGNTFPKNWVRSSALLKITNQKYFDRRARELRDQCGCDIETQQISGEHQYRLGSSAIKSANPRYYLSDSEKRSLFERHANTCQICGRKAESGVRGLQADHKVPLIRGGGTSIENWQAICNECNVAKRRACQGCSVDCSSCQWAFPERTGVPITLRLPAALFDLVDAKTKLDPKWLIDLISGSVSR